MIAALGIKLEAVLPGGRRVRIVDPPKRRRARSESQARGKRSAVPA
jgi:hypothetical protein